MTRRGRRRGRITIPGKDTGERQEKDLSVKEWIERGPQRYVTREEAWNLLNTAVGKLLERLEIAEAKLRDLLPDLTSSAPSVGDPVASEPGATGTAETEVAHPADVFSHLAT